MNSELTFQLVALDSLAENQKSRMFHLMHENYNKVTEDIFFHDLSNKEWIGLIMDHSGLIHGFTTFVINPKGVGGSHYHIIFSGDTVIAPAYWGSQIMMQGWCRAVGSFIASDMTKPWYWYLLSKGHRTYMYLPLFFEYFYPSPNPGQMNAELRKLADEVSSKLFGEYWYPKEGVIRFDASRGELKAELSEATFQKKGSLIANFFLNKNPRFYEGEELVCTALIHPDKVFRSARAFILEGMQHPIVLQSSRN